MLLEFVEIALFCAGCLGAPLKESEKKTCYNCARVLLLYKFQQQK